MNETAPPMDRRLKERLVGATILVALIVIVAPELLSGPRPAARPATAVESAGTRTVLVEVQSHKAMPEQPQASDAGDPRMDVASAHEGASSASASGTPAATAPPASAIGPPTLENVASTPSLAARTPGPIANGHAPWSVQVGVFASRTNAERLLHQLKSDGTPAYLLTSGTGPKQRYRIRVGPLTDRAAAERTVTRLKAGGHTATVVAPGAAG